ncbi:hypothetical protein FWF89_03800 [Candidatus Saccharibacteria bacterium]|nr:hypothetical protein [Candidatus Saccharibacteria bacterium]
MKKKEFGKMSRAARIVATCQIVVCVLAVGWMVFAGFYFNREAIAMRSLDFLVKDYYENYIYDKFLVEKYVEDGFPDVRLQQLLSFDGARNVKYAPDFYDCDKKNTKVKITPVKPFGRKDYSFVTELDCERK